MPQGEAGGLNGSRNEADAELVQEIAGGFRGDFILHDNMGLELLFVLRAEAIGKGMGKTAMQAKQGCAFKGVGDAFAQRAQAGYGDGKRCRFAGGGGKLIGDERLFR